MALVEEPQVCVERGAGPLAELELLLRLQRVQLGDLHDTTLPVTRDHSHDIATGRERGSFHSKSHIYAPTLFTRSLTRSYRDSSSSFFSIESSFSLSQPLSRERETVMSMQEPLSYSLSLQNLIIYRHLEREEAGQRGFIHVAIFLHLLLIVITSFAQGRRVKYVTSASEITRRLHF